MLGQNITRFIEVTGAANIGWTEAGLIAGNDFHNGGTSYALYARSVRHPVRMDRFYVPSWIEEDRRMYAALDRTRARIEREREAQLEMDRMVAEAHLSQDHPMLLELFGLEWDTDSA